MNNLDKMKEDVCKHINKICLEEFYELFLQIEAFTDEKDDDENRIPLENLLKNVFTCSKCRKLYGVPCTKDADDDAPCFERFKQYCEQEV